MSPDEFSKLLTEKQEEIQKALRRSIPLKVSVAIEEHTKDNFRQGGFVDGGLHPWKTTLRQKYGKGADAKYTPLLSREQNLMNANKHRYEPFKAVAYNDAPYAAIHNFGGRITVTPRMKRFFWARFKDTGTEMYKFLALKKVGDNIIIPRRQFMGESRELTTKVTGIVERELNKILMS